MPIEPKSENVMEPAVAAFPAWRKIAEALKDLRFGEVTVIVQESQIVQIDRLEKLRLRPIVPLPTA